LVVNNLEVPVAKPLSVVRENEEGEAQTRSCGQCTACCRVLGIPELMKPRDTACTFLKKHKRCSCYATRPQSCQDYQCLWLQNWFGRAQDRPDRLGLIFDSAEPLLAYLLKETGVSVVICREVWPGAHKQKKAWAALKAVALKYPVIYMGTGLPGLIALKPSEELALSAALTKLDSMSDEELATHKLRALADYEAPVKAMTMPTSELRKVLESTPADRIARVIELCNNELPLMFDVSRKTGEVSNVRVPPDDVVVEFAAEPGSQKFKRLVETDEMFTAIGTYRGVDLDVLREYSRLHEEVSKVSKEEETA
jgi:hypothetical protein